MTNRLTAHLAWPLWTLALCLAVAQVVLQISNQPVLHGVDRLQPEVVTIPGFATMGAVLTTRRPRNPIGWVFLAVALGAAVEGFALQYAIRALAIAPGSLPLALRSPVPRSGSTPNQPATRVPRRTSGQPLRQMSLCGAKVRVTHRRGPARFAG